jgi:hypothetical protein
MAHAKIVKVAVDISASHGYGARFRLSILDVMAGAWNTPETSEASLSPGETVLTNGYFRKLLLPGDDFARSKE